MMFALPSVLMAPTITVAFLGLLFFGGMIGGMDVAMNANAIAVERAMTTAIMSSCHGFWSLGGFLGAGIGGVLIAELGQAGHVLIATAVVGGLVWFAWHKAFDDQLEASANQEPSTAALPRNMLPYLIGAVALLCMIPEGSVLDWGALYLRQELASDIAQSGLAFSAFAGTMAIMRFFGDSLRNRFGATKTFRVSALFAGMGLVIAANANAGPMAIAGFAIAGIGVANLVPITFSAAGNLPGYAPGVVISVVTFMGYSGILFAPSLIGFLAEQTGFASVFLLLAFAQVAVFVCAPLAHHADGLARE
jgi:predicted MFS family arabinose efflux permease